MNFYFKPLGDNAVIIKFEEKICPHVNSHIRKTALILERKKPDGIIEWIPTYTTLTVLYKPEVYDYKTICKQLKSLITKSESEKLPPPELIEIPVCYGEEFGPDLQFVAELNKLTTDEVIAIHSNTEYLVYMLGFSPGFPYLGGMDKRIAAPRLDTPRAKVDAGSVGIAGEQTGIYSMTTPGGWRIIGKTPLKLFDLERKNPFLLKAGNLIKFFPITEKEYKNIES